MILLLGFIQAGALAKVMRLNQLSVNLCAHKREYPAVDREC